MTWPRFRDVAAGLGLQASLSIPLSAGRGDVVAALNLYGHDMIAMATLGSRVLSLYVVEGEPELVTSRAAHPRSHRRVDFRMRRVEEHRVLGLAIRRDKHLRVCVADEDSVEK